MMRAFCRRDFFTCSECASFQPQGLRPYCDRAKRIIRYDPTSFGCGDYVTTDSGEQEEPFVPSLSAYL